MNRGPIESTVLPPERVGEWIMGEALGRGGAGVVYAATHGESGKRGAVKVAHAELGAVRNHWFQREANLAVRLRHPHIVALLEWGFEDDRPYLVYERVDGPDLEEVADEMSLSQIVRLGAELLAALGYAHDAGVVHCDVTPANVLIDQDGAARLTDFGLARARDESRARRLSGRRVVSGTPGYLSPEQASGIGSPGPASDLFGCGALLYRVLTGDAPYGGQSAVEIVQKTLSLPPRPMLPRAGLRTPAALADVVQKLLARDPGQRYPCAARASRAWLAAAAAHTPFAGTRRPHIPRVLGLQSMETVLAGDLAGDLETATLAEGGPFSTLRATPAKVITRPVHRGEAPRLARPALVDRVVEELGPDLGHVVALVGPEAGGLDDVMASVHRTLHDRGVRVCSSRGRRGGRGAPFEALASVVLDALDASDVTSLRRGVELLAERIGEARIANADGGRNALVGGLLGVGPTGAMGTAVMDTFAVCEALLEPDRRPVVVLLGDVDGVDAGTLDVVRALTQRSGGGVGAVFVRHQSTPEDGEVRVDWVAPDAAVLDAAWATWSGDASDTRPAETTPADLLALASLHARGVRGFDEFVASLDVYSLALLRAAAVFGGDVPKRGAIDVAAGVSGERVDGATLASLAQMQILTAVDDSCARREPWLRLCSPALADRLLADLDDDLRRRYQTAAAQWLSRYCFDDSATNQARVAALAEQAGLHGSAAHALIEAARIELESGRLRTAAQYIEAALELATGDDEDAIDHARARGWLGEAALAAGRSSDADAHLAAALDVIDPGRPVLVAKLLHSRADAAVAAGQLELALEHLREALVVLGEDGDPMELARVHSLMGWILGYCLGRNEEGIAHGQRALDVAARISAPAFRASLCGRLGANYLRAGDWDGQLETNHEDLRLSATARDTAGMVRANINIGVCLHNRGFLDVAREHTARARDLAERSGSAGARQIADNNLAMIALDDGRDADVDRHVAAVFEGAERTGYHRAVPETLITMARLATRRGDFDAAADCLTRATDTSDVADLEMALRAGALLDLARGDAAGAAERIGRVFATAEHDPYERALSRMTRACILRALGETDEARDLEAEADRVFAALGADPALERRRWGDGDVHGSGG